jgi:Fe-S oxidoreductase
MKTLNKWAKTSIGHLNTIQNPKGKVYLFADEFTNYNDVPIGIAAIELLTRLGYIVQLAPIHESGRTYLSKGLLRKARTIATKNVDKLTSIINNDNVLIGLEPSAILSFRDEYPDLLRGEMQEKACKLGQNSLLLEEFIMREVNKGNISAGQFTDRVENIKLHGHCQQKSIASTLPLRQMLSLPVNYKVEEIPSGCCGMAGSFGYEAEHYEISNKVGELVLFPEVRKAPENSLITAPGTSCRHHIKDGTGRVAVHPVIIMLKALK